MDERIIRLCEENNVTSLVQALSSLKSQKVKMLQRYICQYCGIPIFRTLKLKREMKIGSEKGEFEKSVVALSHSSFTMLLSY